MQALIMFLKETREWTNFLPGNKVSVISSNSKKLQNERWKSCIIQTEGSFPPIGNTLSWARCECLHSVEINTEVFWLDKDTLIALLLHSHELVFAMSKEEPWQLFVLISCVSSGHSGFNLLQEIRSYYLSNSPIGSINSVQEIWRHNLHILKKPIRENEVTSKALSWMFRLADAARVQEETSLQLSELEVNVIDVRTLCW